MTEIMPYPEINPLSGKASQLLVFLHGLGSDGHDLISLAPFMQQALPECHFMSPHGVERFDMAPFGRQWFSLRDRKEEVLKRLVQNSAPKAVEIIRQKQQELGLSNSDTIIFGFSQGTMLGLYLTLTADEPFKAMIACSGRLIEPEQMKNNSTPVCIIHGIDDDIVPVGESERMAEYCAEHNIKHETLFIPNLTHSIDAEAIMFATNFILRSR